MYLCCFAQGSWEDTELCIKHKVKYMFKGFILFLLLSTWTLLWLNEIIPTNYIIYQTEYILSSMTLKNDC